VIVKQNMAMFGYLLLFYISERLFWLISVKNLAK
jgi:hypothetical protein